MSATVLTRSTVILTEPFVRTGVYASSEQALKHIILNYLDRQIARAEARLRRYEFKYHCSFAEWTTSLAGKATVADEDAWMEWEAAIDVLDGWRQIKAEVAQIPLT